MATVKFWSLRVLSKAGPQAYTKPSPIVPRSGFALADLGVFPAHLGAYRELVLLLYVLHPKHLRIPP